MKELLDLLFGESAGNAGSLLAGLSIVYLARQYYLSRGEKMKDQYREKTERTFSLVQRFGEFEKDKTLLNITNFVDNILERKPNTALTVFDKDTNRIPFGSEVEYNIKLIIIDRCLRSLYMYMKEVAYMLAKNEQYDLIDQGELGNFLQTYALQLKDFFIAVDLRNADQYKFQAKAEWWGRIERDDFLRTKGVIIDRFGFLK